MVRARTVQPVQIPPPVKGMVDEASMLPAEQGYARQLRNLIVRPSYVYERPSQDTLSISGASSTLTYFLWGSSGDNAYLYDNGRLEQEDGTLLYASSFSSGPINEHRFKTDVFLCNSDTSEPIIQRRNSSWGAFQFTLASLTNSEVIGSTSYRGRMYFWGSDSGIPTVEYANAAGNVNGATTAYQPDEFLAGGEQIAFCSPVVVEIGIDTTEVFALYGDRGTVLIFNGSEPGSWALTASYKMSPPAGLLSYVRIQGDVVVAARDYSYSTRDLFANGSNIGLTNSTTAQISDLYRRFALTDVTVTYYPALDCIIYMGAYAAQFMPSDDDDYTFTGTYFRSAQLVYFRETQSWAIWDVPQLRGTVRATTIESSGITRGILEWHVGNKEMRLGTSYAYLDEIASDAEISFVSSLGNRRFYSVVETGPLSARNGEISGVRWLYRHLRQALTSISYYEAVGALKELDSFNGSVFREPQDNFSALASQQFTIDAPSSLSAIPLQSEFSDMNIQGYILTLYAQSRNFGSGVMVVGNDRVQGYGWEIFFQQGGVLE